MLADTTLAELARNTPLREALVRIAWPSLGVESKLRLIELIQGEGIGRTSPRWLVNLSLSDDAAIVRYWAARAYYFSQPLSEDDELWRSEFFRPTEDDLELTQHVRADQVPLVQSCSESALPNFSGLDAMSQISRLRAIRESRSAFFENFVDWLAKCVDERLVPDEELAACAEEFFGSHSFTCIAAQLEDDRDGYISFSTGNAIEKAWALLGRAELRLAEVLAIHTPFSFAKALTGVAPEVLDSLPERAQKILLYREEPEALAFHGRVRDAPEKFSEALVKDLAYQDEHAWEFRSRGSTARPEPEGETLSQSLARAHHRLDELQQSMQELRDLVLAASQRRRGLFG